MSLSRYKISAPDTIYHLYNRGNHKQLIFQESDDYRFYRALVVKYCRDINFSIISYCLMPNHIHLLVRQNSNDSPAKLMSRLHTSYAMYYNKKYGKVGHLFQDRYKQKIVSDESYLLVLIAYIHLNPVKDKLVDRPGQYRWSSFLDHHNNRGSIGICDQVAIAKLGITAIVSEVEMDHLATKVDLSDTFPTDKGQSSTSSLS